jgi:AraC-like DNA-binding protein
MEPTSRGRHDRPGASVSRREVVKRAETYLRAHMEDSVPLARLCRIVGRSERGLRDAFYGVHGMSPKRWMLTERLQRARRALSEPGNARTTVTGVATDFGFYQLGRFAAAYKGAFGETPSATLRGSARRAAAPTTSYTKGHADACTN